MVATRFRMNAPRVVDETIDGETLIMDMVNGSYFSCVGSSSVAWNALRAGSTIAETAQVLGATYGVDVTDAERDLDPFLAALLDDGLLVVHDAPAPTLAAADPTTPLGDYQAPQVEKYTDLADLILLDPVHDVTEAGWPAEPE
jgi:hypothetical protein